MIQVYNQNSLFLNILKKSQILPEISKKRVTNHKLNQNITKIQTAMESSINFHDKVDFKVSQQLDFTSLTHLYFL